MDTRKELLSRSGEMWDDIVPVLEKYITIPNKSPHFDSEWKKNGHMDAAVKLFAGWAEEQKKYIPGLTVEVQEIEGRTPLIYIEVPGNAPGNLLMYGHLDKQPEFKGWTNGREPWKPQREGNRLYGRGGADDGYAMFAALSALRMLAEKGIPYAKTSVIVEASEESGSPDLPAHLEKIADRVGTPDVVICLDSGTGDYDRFWETTSLRGIVAGNLKVEVLREGVHSGAASGVVPDTYMVANNLLRRIQNPDTGEILLEQLHADVPHERIVQAEKIAELFKEEFYKIYPFLEGVKPLDIDVLSSIMNKTWRPALTVTGSNLPAIKDAGNTLRPSTELWLSMRIPPGVDPEIAGQVMKEALEADPPFDARVTFEPLSKSTGWNAPKTAEWLAQAEQEVSKGNHSSEAMAWGEGGTIPFMPMLGKQFPEAQFVVTGVLGPESNAHGPNEFLELDYVRRVTADVAHIVAAHAEYRLQVENQPLGKSVDAE